MWVPSRGDRTFPRGLAGKRHGEHWVLVCVTLGLRGLSMAGQGQTVSMGWGPHWDLGVIVGLGVEPWGSGLLGVWAVLLPPSWSPALGGAQCPGGEHILVWPCSYVGLPGVPFCSLTVPAP